MPTSTFVEIPEEEQAQMRAALRRARYGSLLALPILLLCAVGRHPTEIAAVAWGHAQLRRCSGTSSGAWRSMTPPTGTPGFTCQKFIPIQEQHWDVLDEWLKEGSPLRHGALGTSE